MCVSVCVCVRACGVCVCVHIVIYAVIYITFAEFCFWLTRRFRLNRRSAAQCLMIAR